VTTRECPLAPATGAPLAARVRHRASHVLIPLLRTYVRYAPRALWKQRLWDRVVEPRFAWHRRRFVARTRFGAAIAGETTEILQQYIYYFGLWEPEITRWIERALQPGDGFIDVGANIGYFSLLASKLVGERGAVVAIEPSPELFAALEAHVARNGAGNVRMASVAASEREERGRM
jgi:hypothetical protein